MTKKKNDSELIETTIGFDTAKLANERGFICKSSMCDEIYLEDGTKHWNLGTPLKDWDAPTPITYQAPTQALLQRWLREEHNIHLNPDVANLYPKTTYHSSIYYEGYRTWVEKEYNSYEGAFENGLQAALKFMKT